MCMFVVSLCFESFCVAFYFNVYSSLGDVFETKNMVVSMKDKLKALKTLEGSETLSYIVCKLEF